MPGDDPAYEGFHTYATSDLYDTNGQAERWPDNWASPVPVNTDPEPDDDDAEDVTRHDYWSVLLWTAGWYAVPLIILILRALTQSNTPHLECTAAGLGNCASPRADALGDLVSNAPIWCFALVAALSLAVVLRWASDRWRPATIGFCAAVVSGGVITALARIW